MEEGAGGDSSDNDMLQPARRTIRACDDRQQLTEEGRTQLRVKAEFFYLEDRMVASIDPEWLKTSFYTLTGLFICVGLKTNVRKTVGMVCHPCRADGVCVDEAYTRQMTGEVRSYKERHQDLVSFPDCRKYLDRVLLSAHFQTQHGVTKGGPGQEGDREGR